MREENFATMVLATNIMIGNWILIYPHMLLDVSMVTGCM